VIRPGPNCLTRGFSVKLLSSLTIIVNLLRRRLEADAHPSGVD
jgi:hypothetical protein